MSGKNIILKPGASLFLEGDPSNGMYLVRSGVLKIYLNREGKEVLLAQVTSGAMIGEMALFDEKPRSASAAALKTCEVTFISKSEFEQLMKMIPKWFKGLMSTLSGRLRDTNSRLQALEVEKAKYNNSLHSSRRLLEILDIMFHNLGEKAEEKNWSIPLKSFEAFVMLHLGLNQWPKDFYEKLDLANICKKVKKSSSESILCSNRSVFKKLIEMITHLSLSSNEAPTYSMIQILQTLNSASQNLPYSQLTLSLGELMQLAKKNNLTIDLNGWTHGLKRMKTIGPPLTFVEKASDGMPGIRTQKEALPPFVESYEQIFHIAQIFST